MNQKEKELFKGLCSFKTENFDKSLLEAATPTVLGQLFFNRMQSVSYGVLKKHDILSKVNREFRNSLKVAYEQNIEKNKSFFFCVQHVAEVLSTCNCKYAMLKGAYLCKCYPDGYRTSNDIDLLVESKDISEIGNALLKAGFKQGNIRNDQFVPATRKDIIESKMMRGETIPYIKSVNLPGMRYLEVDINFSLDYKPGETDVLKEMLSNSTIEKIGGFNIPMLRKDDFFIHLCCHLYKEATTFPWVEMMRDMTLYKYSDIYMLINDANKEYVDCIFERAKHFQMEKICAFAILQVSELFYLDNKYAVQVADDVLRSDKEFLHTVISPKDKKEYVYTEKSVSKRLFSNNRKNLLKEVEQNANIKNENS